ncbi:hypothetical protein BaRGS_00002379 [Batillaria attramentaria]|uniref:Uncharacterized protein n=1 Tax=Batillaria attramentaria TaxID=370345 RepID=A0ABD0M3K2_9CAEN
MHNVRGENSKPCTRSGDPTCKLMTMSKLLIARTESIVQETGYSLCRQSGSSFLLFELFTNSTRTVPTDVHRLLHFKLPKLKFDLQEEVILNSVPV